MARSALLLTIAVAILQCISRCDAYQTRALTARDDNLGCVNAAWEVFKTNQHKLNSDTWWLALRPQLRPRTIGIHSTATMASTVLEAIKACDLHTNLTCTTDATLPHVPAQRTFIAAALKDVGGLMPRYILELLMALGQMSEDQTFVSIYESGSSDSTVQWLLLLDEILDSIGMMHRIITDGVARVRGQDRIDFVAHIRNAVIAPMLQGNGSAAPEWPAERLLFINDVFFCARHIIRLLQHNTVSAACGMDFWKHYDKPELPGLFYDTWVMRDADGRQVDIKPPYVKHAYSRQRLENGLTFPVSCCWNGMISLDARPFMLGTRFRVHREGECMESEASQCCTDFFQLGYHDFIVDPGIHVAYKSDIAAEDGAPELHIKKTTFAELQRAEPIDWDFVPKAFYRTCCNKVEGTDQADQTHCDDLPIKTKRNTAEVFRRHHMQALNDSSKS